MNAGVQIMTLKLNRKAIKRKIRKYVKGQYLHPKTKKTILFQGFVSYDVADFTGPCTSFKLFLKSKRLPLYK